MWTLTLDWRGLRLASRSMASQRVGCCSVQLETDGAKDTSGWQAKSQPTTIAHTLVRLTESVPGRVWKLESQTDLRIIRAPATSRHIPPLLPAAAAAPAALFPTRTPTTSSFTRHWTGHNLSAVGFPDVKLLASSSRHSGTKLCRINMALASLHALKTCHDPYMH